MELLLLRHGLTRANLEHRFCGRTDWPLLPEAYRALDPMVQSGALPVVEIACHTGLLRTLQTAERLFPGVPLQSAPALSEFDFGEFEALTHEDLQHHPDYIRWLMEFETMACPHGESRPEFIRRVRIGWQALYSLWTSQPKSNQTRERQVIEKAALVTHGGVIAVLMNDWFPGDRDLLDWQPDCGAGYRIKFSSDRPMLVESFGARTV